MPARRRPLAALAAGSAVLALSACGEAPAPIVSVYSGDTSLYDESFSYCFEGQDPALSPGDEGACRYDADRSPEVLQVRPGDQVLVDVDKELADAAWFVTLTGEDEMPVRVSPVESDSHTTRVLPDFNTGIRQTLGVTMLESEEEGAPVVGVWQFEVVPRT